MLLSLLQVCVRTELGPTGLQGTHVGRSPTAAVAHRTAAVATGCTSSSRALLLVQEHSMCCARCSWTDPALRSSFPGFEEPLVALWGRGGCSAALCHTGGYGHRLVPVESQFAAVFESNVQAHGYRAVTTYVLFGRLLPSTCPEECWAPSQATASPGKSVYPYSCTQGGECSVTLLSPNRAPHVGSELLKRRRVQRATRCAAASLKLATAVLLASVRSPAHPPPSHFDCLPRFSREPAAARIPTFVVVSSPRQHPRASPCRCIGPLPPSPSRARSVA